MSSDFDEAYYREANPDVVLAIQRGLVKSGWEHFMRFGKDEGRLGLPPAGQAPKTRARAHRQAAVPHLTGRGIEVGALDRPHPVSPGAEVTYVDRFDAAEAKELLVGLADVPLTEVDRVLELDRDGLSAFEAETYDFAILCNVLQHLANPIRAIQEAFRVVRPGGTVVLSVPDHRHTFEASRPVTPFDHLLDEYLEDVRVVTDAHYVDLIVLFCANEIAAGVAGIAPRLAELRRRGEHAHVWDTAGFDELVKRGLRVVDVDAETLVRVTGDETESECFVVLRKVRQMLA